MASLISTGQIDLGSLKEYLLRPNPESLSGSANNITGFYPYTGNPADFAHSGYVDSVGGDISGYIDAVSGVLASRIGESGVALSGYTSEILTELKSDIDFISGKNIELSGVYSSANVLSLENQADIDLLSGSLITSGQDLSLLITGESGQGVSGFVTGFVDTTSGALDVKITNLDTNLRNHVEEDYLSKRNESEYVSGSVTFGQPPILQQGVKVQRVADHDEVANYQSGAHMYSMVSGVTVGGASHQVLTTYLRYPHSGDSARQNLIVGSFMYSGVIP